MKYRVSHETDLEMLRCAVFGDDHIRRNTLDAEFVTDVCPLGIRHPVMFALDVRDHLLPSPFRRVFTGQVKEYDIFANEVFLHRLGLFHRSFARTAPGCPEVDENHLSAIRCRDGIEQLFCRDLGDIHTVDGVAGFLFILLDKLF